MRFFLFCFCFLWSFFPSVADAQSLQSGADQMHLYLPGVRGRNVAVVANHTSRVGSTHLVDTLIACGVKVVKIFSPEHGFRGQADAGQKVGASVDEKTGIRIVSLYGSHRKPSSTDLEGIDLVLYDLQDVGARFYTYLSTLHYVMESCAENGLALMILDRPNPNGYFVDGPMLNPALKSFVGMHPVPIVHGMTTAEYAQMINGEGWLAGKTTCSLGLILCKGYVHSDPYPVPLNPSPNLKSSLAVWLYPSLCFFEGTPYSLGRGTEAPFMMYGHPDYPLKDFQFTPESLPGANQPPLLGEICFGRDLRGLEPEEVWSWKRINLSFLLDAFSQHGEKSKFFTDYFDQLAGTRQLKEQIRSGWTEEQIRSSWKKDLDAFKVKRKRYLLYEDFE